MTPVIGMLTASTPLVRFCANANLDTKEVALNANVSDDVFGKFILFLSKLRKFANLSLFCLSLLIAQKYKELN